MSFTVGAPVAPPPPTTAIDEPANHALKYANTSSTCAPPTLLKSAWQHGVIPLPAALHTAVPVGKVHRLFGPVHSTCVSSAHVLPRQQLPVGCGHGWGRQSTSLPRYVPAAVVHAARDRMLHAPEAAQHAPVAGGQLAAEHSTPEPANVPGHCRESIEAHVPSRKQHAPICGKGHSVVSHTAFPVHVFPAAQFTNSTLVHTPVTVLQQAPRGGCGQGFVGVHEAPSVQTFGAAHATSRIAVQEPLLTEQHVPSTGCTQGLPAPHTAAALHVLGLAQLTCAVVVHPPV